MPMYPTFPVSGANPQRQLEDHASGKTPVMTLVADGKGDGDVAMKAVKPSAKRARGDVMQVDKVPTKVKG